MCKRPIKPPRTLRRIPSGIARVTVDQPPKIEARVISIVKIIAKSYAGYTEYSLSDDITTPGDHVYFLVSLGAPRCLIRFFISRNGTHYWKVKVVDKLLGYGNASNVNGVPFRLHALYFDTITAHELEQMQRAIASYANNR